MPWRGTEKAIIVFQSTTNGEFASNGGTETLSTWKLPIITHEKERIMAKRISNIHPGEILLEEFLKPMGISAYRLSKETKIDQTRISEIIKGKRSISVDTALRFSKFFSNSPEFWINLQNHFDIEEKKRQMEQELKKIKSFIPQMINA
jgi:addiction module HigA family antidote